MSNEQEPTCGPVWEEIEKLQKQGVNVDALMDVFTDFECSWTEHTKEFHIEEEE